MATLESDISQIHSEFRSNKEMHEKDLKEKTELLTVVEEELKTVRGQMDNLQVGYLFILRYSTTVPYFF